jgi:hypothetical protein
MKVTKLSLMIAAVLVAGTVGSMAQTNDYLIKKASGTITDDTGKTKVVNADLVSTNTNTLVLRIIKNDPRRIRLEERDSTGTNLVSTIISSFREAFLANGQFGGDLEASSSVFNGDLQIQGKETPATNPTKVKATLTGVFNDKIANTNDVDSLFKGTISGTILP